MEPYLCRDMWRRDEWVCNVKCLKRERQSVAPSCSVNSKHLSTHQMHSSHSRARVNACWSCEPNDLPTAGKFSVLKYGMRLTFIRAQSKCVAVARVRCSETAVEPNTVRIPIYARPLRITHFICHSLIFHRCGMAINVEHSAAQQQKFDALCVVCFEPHIASSKHTISTVSTFHTSATFEENLIIRNEFVSFGISEMVHNCTQKLKATLREAGTEMCYGLRTPYMSAWAIKLQWHTTMAKATSILLDCTLYPLLQWIVSTLKCFYVFWNECINNSSWRLNQIENGKLAASCAKVTYEISSSLSCGRNVMFICISRYTTLE